jgi:hypothetical protein
VHHVVVITLSRPSVLGAADGATYKPGWYQCGCCERRCKRRREWRGKSFVVVR